MFSLAAVGADMDYDEIAAAAAREGADEAGPARGAYVQAWVWVEVEGAHPTDDDFREAARQQWSWGGEIEIDDGAAVSAGDVPAGGGEHGPPPAPDSAP